MTLGTFCRGASTMIGERVRAAHMLAGSPSTKPNGGRHLICNPLSLVGQTTPISQIRHSCCANTAAKAPPRHLLVVAVIQEAEIDHPTPVEHQSRVRAAMPLPAVNNIKGAWRRSLRLPGASASTLLNTSTMPHDFGDAFAPITIAVIGCGNRGRVRTVLLHILMTPVLSRLIGHRHTPAMLSLSRPNARSSRLQSLVL